ncbi:MAG: hypothetical protein IKG21_04905 [Atopobiaceae bacterium]|nr:hypothetical protein [Atopobiaceae bacterium]
MRTKTKKTLSTLLTFVLSLAMIAGLCPTNALATALEEDVVTVGPGDGDGDAFTAKAQNVENVESIENDEAFAVAQGRDVGEEAQAQPQAGEPYDVWIGGTQVTSENLVGTGWSYDASTSTLTLNGYSYSGEGYSWQGNCYACIYASQDLTISLAGENSVSNTHTYADDLICAICVVGNLSIDGSGMLTVDAGNRGLGIYCTSGTIKNGTVSATGGEGVRCNDLSVENGILTATGIADNSSGAGIEADGDVTITGGTVTAAGTDPNHFSYGIRCGGNVRVEGGTVHATSAYGNGIEFNTNVTISGGNVTATGGDYGFYSGSGSVTVEGGTVNATCTGEDGSGVLAVMDVAISGGTVIASGANAGIISYVGELTINGGDVTASGSSLGGLYTQGGTIKVAEGLVAKAGASEADAQYVADLSTWEHGEAWVRIASHIHELTYSATGDTITVTCAADGCAFPVVDGTPTATLTISAPTTDGGEATLEVDPEGAFGDLVGKVQYQTKTGGAWGDQTTTAPTTAGIHKASITLSEKTASVSYGVNCITYATGLSNGSVSGATGATCGATVTPTITPGAGYQLDTLTVTPEEGSGVSDVSVTDGTFVMPEGNVTVSATFKPITYSVEANGATATVTDDTPDQHTYTAELTSLPSDKTYDGKPVNLSATVQKSDGFPSQVTVGSVSFKDKSGQVVTTATDVGAYTASATVGDKTISKTFRINGQTPVNYEVLTLNGGVLNTSTFTIDQYIPLANNPYDITVLSNGLTYVAREDLVIGALVYMGDANLIICEDVNVTVYAGVHHIGSSLNIYNEVGHRDAVLDVKGDGALSSLNNYSDFVSANIQGTGSTLSGTIRVYGGKLIAEKGSNASLFADDISLTIGAALAAKGSSDNSVLAYITGGQENSDGSVTYDKSNLLSLTKLDVEQKPTATVSTAPAAKTLTCNGKAQELVAAGRAEGGEMSYALGTESKATGAYAAAIPTATDAGTYYVWYKVVGDENHFDSEEGHVTATIAEAQAPVPAKDKLTSIARVGEKTYTSKAIKPTPAVKAGSKTLKAGTDFAYSYKANVKVGTATVTATGKGSYEGSVSTTFKIRPAQLTSIARVADQAFAGKAVTPKPAVRSGSKALKAGTDFSYGYKANAKAGTATVTATGRGNYTGTVKTTFKIVAAATSGRAHLQGSGWQATKSDPAFYGTTGRSLRMEALSLSLPAGFPVKGSIQYRSHLQGRGWESKWASDGATSGTIGESRRIEAIQVRLTGDVAKRYDVYYRVHAQNYGWMGWARNGAKAGTQGMSRRAEAVQVVLVPKGAAAPAATYRGQTRGYAKAFVS